MPSVVIIADAPPVGTSLRVSDLALVRIGVPYWIGSDVALTAPTDAAAEAAGRETITFAGAAAGDPNGLALMAPLRVSHRAGERIVPVGTYTGQGPYQPPVPGPRARLWDEGGFWQTLLFGKLLGGKRRRRGSK